MSWAPWLRSKQCHTRHRYNIGRRAFSASAAHQPPDPVFQALTKSILADAEDDIRAKNAWRDTRKCIERGSTLCRDEISPVMLALLLASHDTKMQGAALEVSQSEQVSRMTLVFDGLPSSRLRGWHQTRAIFVCFNKIPPGTTSSRLAYILNLGAVPDA